MKKEKHENGFEKRLAAYGRSASANQSADTRRGAGFVGAALTAGLACAVAPQADAAILAETLSSPATVNDGGGSIPIAIDSIGTLNVSYSGGKLVLSSGGGVTPYLNFVDIPAVCKSTSSGIVVDDSKCNGGGGSYYWDGGSQYLKVLNKGASVEGEFHTAALGIKVKEVIGASKRYLGLKFDVSGVEKYGWMEVAGSDSSSITITAWGYEDSGAAIKTGDTGNAAPCITVAGTTLPFIENGSPIQIDANATVSDSDGDADWNGGSLKAQITANAESSDELSISDTDGDGTAITVSGTNILAGGIDVGDLSASGGVVTGGTALTITFDSDATNANVQEVLQSLRYRNTSDDPGTGNRTVTVTATDKNSSAASDTRTISVTPENDAPDISVAHTALAWTEGDGPVAIDAAATLSDAEGNWDGGSLTARISGNAEVLDCLAFPASGEVVLSGNEVKVSGVTVGTVDVASVTGSGTLTLTFNAAADNASVQKVLRGLTYENTSQAPGTDPKTVTFLARDGASESDAGSETTRTIQVTPGNDAPSIAVNSGLALDEGGTETLTNTHLKATDVDDSGDGLTFTLTSAPANGSLSLGVSTLVKEGTFTQADIDGGKVAYTHDGGETTSDSFVFSLADGGEDGAAAVTGQTFSITINAVNDAPTAITLSPASVEENKPVGTVVGTLSAEDSDN